MDKTVILLISSIGVGYFLKEYQLKDEFKKNNCEEIKQNYLNKNSLLFLLSFLLLTFIFLFFN